jgi:hypothetical protein
MRSCIIHDLPDWRVTSWGNGLTYEIEHKPSGRDMFFQGEDAEQFRTEFDNLTTGLPCLSFTDALQAIFAEYEELQNV